MLLLSGSPKPEGNTVQLLKECAQVIEAHGVDAEIITLVGKKIDSCALAKTLPSLFCAFSN
ncbi:NAD(P)H-dependent oxidoreductase [Heliophilum fasciatum]|uniref:NAD(P)H-dependent oxidoreductase n=1 Tax=Heliophilum fasciatum TaxID=35700 RepID=UPI001FA94D7B|nr:NAD(P)H-dependent oxidoreductase [Heliophilum fasciatum]